MTQCNRMMPFLLAAAVAVALLIGFGAPVGSLLPLAAVLACPLMMIVMMRGMAGMHGASDDRGREHDTTRAAEPPTPPQ